MITFLNNCREYSNCGLYFILNKNGDINLGVDSLENNVLMSFDKNKTLNSQFNMLFKKYYSNNLCILNNRELNTLICEKNISNFNSYKIFSQIKLESVDDIPDYIILYKRYSEKYLIVDSYQDLNENGLKNSLKEFLNEKYFKFELKKDNSTLNLIPSIYEVNVYNPLTEDNCSFFCNLDIEPNKILDSDFDKSIYENKTINPFIFTFCFNIDVTDKTIIDEYQIKFAFKKSEKEINFDNISFKNIYNVNTDDFLAKDKYISLNPDTDFFVTKEKIDFNDFDLFLKTNNEKIIQINNILEENPSNRIKLLTDSVNVKDIFGLGERTYQLEVKKYESEEFKPSLKINLTENNSKSPFNLNDQFYVDFLNLTDLNLNEKDFNFKRLKFTAVNSDDICCPEDFCVSNFNKSEFVGVNSLITENKTLEVWVNGLIEVEKDDISFISTDSLQTIYPTDGNNCEITKPVIITVLKYDIVHNRTKILVENREKQFVDFTVIKSDERIFFVNYHLKTFNIFFDYELSLKDQLKQIKQRFQSFKKKNNVPLDLQIDDNNLIFIDLVNSGTSKINLSFILNLKTDASKIKINDQYLLSDIDYKYINSQRVTILIGQKMLYEYCSNILFENNNLNLKILNEIENLELFALCSDRSYELINTEFNSDLTTTKSFSTIKNLLLKNNNIVLRAKNLNKIIYLQQYGK